MMTVYSEKDKVRRIDVFYCPKCKKELPRQELVLHDAKMNKAKTPQLIITEYRVKRCDNCEQYFYVKSNIINAKKGV